MRLKKIKEITIMADEMNKNIDNEEIDLDALEDVSGGVMKSSQRSVLAVRRIFSAKEIDIIKESFPDCDIKPNV